MEQQFGVKLTFPEARHGYWDGGRKKGGTFTPDWLRRGFIASKPWPKGKHPGPGNIIKWGCFRLNFWFTCRSGRTWREAASIAKRKLAHLCEVPGATVEIVQLERTDKARLLI